MLSSLLLLTALTTTLAAPAPTPTNPHEPRFTPPPARAPSSAQGAFGRGSLQDGGYIPGDYVDGYEYNDWAWALIYRPDDGGTFCLDTYNQHPDAPAAMVAYLGDSNDKGTAAFVAGSWKDYAGAVCVKGMDSSCVDIFAQWGNLTYAAKGVHCNACGDASHSQV